MITKGALSNVLEVCTQAATQSSTGETQYVLLDQVRDQVQARFQTWSDAGYRVLAVATKRHSARTLSKDDEAGMTLMGFLTFADPLKPNIAEALDQLRLVGIDLKWSREITRQ